MNAECGIRNAESGGGPAPAPQPAPSRCRYVMRFAVDGDLRYLTHHDTLRLLRRALARAALPLAFSKGFNPQPQIGIPLPRPLGIASEDEAAVFELDAELPVRELRERLSRVLPTGVRLRGVGPLSGRDALHAQAVAYATELPENIETQQLCARIRDVLGADRLVIQRESGPDKPARPFDLRPFIETLECTESTLRMRLRVTQQGAARPGEVLAAAGLDPVEYICKTRRVCVDWNMSLPAD